MSNGFDEMVGMRRTIISPVTEFGIRPEMDDWLSAAQASGGKSLSGIINCALELSVTRRLAGLHGLRSLFWDTLGRVAHELPPVSPPFEPSPDDRRVACELVPEPACLLRWAKDTCGASYETTLHEGIRILGAWAATPGVTFKVVEEGDYDHERAVEYLWRFPYDLPPLRDASL